MIDALNALGKRKALFLLLLLGASLLFRLPTLFNDYYDVDELAAIVQTQEYRAGDVPGRDFSESKLPLYHALFKAAYALSPERGWVVLHAFAVLIVFLTALSVYFAGLRIGGFPVGALGSLFYAVFISSFNRHFMAVNGEIVYNLPVAAGFAFFLAFLQEKGLRKYLSFLFCLVLGVAAAQVKFHGLILFIFLGVFFILYRRYYDGSLTRKYLALWGGLFLFLAAAFTADLMLSDKFASFLIYQVSSKLFYAAAQGSQPLIMAGKFLHRQGMLLIWHILLWVPAFWIMARFLSGRMRYGSGEQSALILMFLFTYLMVFAGGSRLYFHYFMTCYPFLCLASAMALSEETASRMDFFRRRATVLLLVPALFFWGWNVKDVVIRNCYPRAFYGEGKILYWARAVLVGSFNDYLLPEGSYMDAADYIRRITRPGERIFVWGDGPYLYYFSGRRMGIRHLWPKTSVILINSLYTKGDDASRLQSRRMEEDFVQMMETKKPVLFVDTSPNGLTNFRFPPPPVVRAYVEKSYRFLKEVNRMRIYARRGYEPLPEGKGEAEGERP